MAGRVLMCRNAAEAVALAEAAAWRALVVEARQRGGGLAVRTAEMTVFGPSVRAHEGADAALVASMAQDTAAQGAGDVLLAVYGADLREEVARRLGDAGVRVGAPEGPAPADDEGALASLARRRPPTAGTARGGLVPSYVTAYPDEGGALRAGDEVRMGRRVRADGRTEVFYAARGGRRVGLHGVVPRLLSSAEAARLAAVRAAVRAFTFGRERLPDGRERDTQVLVLDIPADVDEMLADARVRG